MKVCSSLKKMISDGVNNFTYKINAKVDEVYRNALPNHKNANMRTSTVHLHCIDLIDMQIQD